MSLYSKLIFAIFLIAGNYAFAQCPENIGFEDGTFKNWLAFTGSISPAAGVITTNDPGMVPQRHRVIKAADREIDTFGGFPVASPNGSKYAVKLGNAASGAQAERLSYTFTVPMIPNYSLIMNYAMVLQNPRHGDYEQSRFTVKVYNVTDHQTLDCPSFNFIANDRLPGFQLSTAVVPGVSPTDTYYKDWTTTTIDLSNYLGKTITIDFTTNDCSQGGHFGYVYFDINESCTQKAITGNEVCADQPEITLQGPRGFNEYAWYNADKTIKLGDKKDLVLNPAPAAGTKYFLTVKAQEGLGCDGEFTTVINRPNAPFVFLTKPIVYMCVGNRTDLTAPDITAGSTPEMVYEYYRDALVTDYLQNPEAVTKEGDYYIKATNAAGCTNIAKIEVRFLDAVNITTISPTIQYPNKVDLSATHNREPGYKYFYYADARASKVLDDYSHINSSGLYFVKAVTNNGCDKIVPVRVTVTPPPPSVIEGPTAFTPNNDGINDKFTVTVKGYVSFGMLRIYNRNGQLVFTAKSQSDLWDGTTGGRNLPFGIYYWVFTGTDQYYKTTVTKSGQISIIK